MGINMKIYYLLNENNEIIQDDFEPFAPNCLERDREEYNLVNGYNGALFFVEYTQTEEYRAKAAAFEARSEIRALRERRQTECFDVVNRGAVWYERLTDTQKAELAEWYQLWLDVTQTKVVPEPLAWLK